MNDSELKDRLSSVPVPERSSHYWDEFPKRVMFEIQRRETTVQEAEPSILMAPPWWFALLSKRVLSASAALICVALAFVLGVRQERQTAAGERQLVEAQKCYREIEALFPNQVRALVFDKQGMHLVLAEQPDVPSSPPLYVTITGQKDVNRFVTFSGQRIRVNEDSFEVLVDRQGVVLLVGQQSVWSSSDPGMKAGPYRIEARPLPATS